MVGWLKHCVYHQHGIGSKSTCTILSCPWKIHFMALSPAWYLASISYLKSYLYELQVDSNILSSLEADWVNCLPYALAPLWLSCKSGG